MINHRYLAIHFCVFDEKKVSSKNERKNFILRKKFYLYFTLTELLYKDYLFAGDALVNRKKQPQIAYQNQHNKKALSSYQKIMELAPKIIFVGHDKIITKI